MEYGYEKASLRRIAKETSVTTGAIYGYFAGKDALFTALPEDVAEELVELYKKVHSDFASLPPEEQSCHDFVAAVEQMGYPVPELGDVLIHIVCSAFFRQIQEFVNHDIPREEAMSCSLILSRFQHAGWKKILNLPS